MSIATVLPNLNDLWHQWNIRFTVMLSFFLQAFLVLFAPLRKTTSNMFVRLFIWLAYLLADWIVVFAIGLITHSQSSKYVPPENSNLLTFWASFLLLHLGGPDTITAFALEDNTFWHRHLIILVFQILAVLYVLSSFSQNKLLVPAVLIFVVGVGKCGERTRALYLARSEINEFTEAAKRVGSIKKYKPPEHALIETERGRKFFEGKAHDSNQRPVSRSQLFLMMTAEGDDIHKQFYYRDAEIAYDYITFLLNYMYGRLFTKNRVIHTAWGYIFRTVSLAFSVIALVLFTCLKKHGFNSFDVRVTYTLLWGAIALDIYALARLILSDEILATIVGESTKETNSLVKGLFVAKCISFLDCKGKPPKKTVRMRDTDADLDILDTPIVHKQWCGSIYAYNFLSKCLKQRPRMIGELKFADHYIDNIHNIFHSLSGFFGAATFHVWQASQAIQVGIVFDKLGLTEIFDTMIYVSKNPFIEKLWELIYEELREKSLLIDDMGVASLIEESRGEWALFEAFWEDQGNEIYLTASKCINDLEYDESLIVWHIATEVCYNTDKSLDKTRIFSKVLSDYMFYLLVKQPATMSLIPGIGGSKCKHILSEAASSYGKLASKPRTKDWLEVTSKNILDLGCGNESNLIYRASELARKLKLLKEKKWNIVSRVWVEMLSYTASHCADFILAQMVSNGGELLTFVSCLMEGFDIGRKPLANGLDNLPDFGRGMRNWTKEKEDAFLKNIQWMKESGLIGERGLTPTILYKLAVNCSVSLYDLILRLKRYQETIPTLKSWKPHVGFE